MHYLFGSRQWTRHQSNNNLSLQQPISQFMSNSNLGANSHLISYFFLNKMHYWKNSLRCNVTSLMYTFSLMVCSTGKAFRTVLLLCHLLRDRTQLLSGWQWNITSSFTLCHKSLTGGQRCWCYRCRKKSTRQQPKVTFWSLWHLGCVYKRGTELYVLARTRHNTRSLCIWDPWKTIQNILKHNTMNRRMFYWRPNFRTNIYILYIN